MEDARSQSEILEALRPIYESIKTSFSQIGPLESGILLHVGPVSVYDLGESGRAAFVMNGTGGIVEVHGGIYDRWKGGGGADGPLGMPVANEEDFHGSDARPGDRTSKFEYGGIVWRADTMETEVRLTDGPTKLSNLDVFLPWSRMKALLSNLKQGGFSVRDVRLHGSSICLDGTAKVKFAVRFEPLRSDDGRSLVFRIESISLKSGWSRFVLFLWKNLWSFNWASDSEEFILRKIASLTSGVRADGKRLQINLEELLSTVLKAPVQVGAIKAFQSNESGLRLLIEGD